MSPLYLLAGRKTVEVTGLRGGFSLLGHEVLLTGGCSIPNYRRSFLVMGGVLEAGSRPGRGMWSCFNKELELELVPELEQRDTHATSLEADS